MTVEALIFLKSKPGKRKILIEWVARSKDEKNSTYAEPGVENVFRSDGKFDVIVQVTKRDKKGVYALVEKIREKKLKKKKRAVKLSHVTFIVHKLPGDP